MQILLSAIARPVRIQTASSRPSSLSAADSGHIVIVIFIWELYEMLPRFPETWLKTEEHNKTLYMKTYIYVLMKISRLS
jgi:hypothetical protein